MKKILNDSNNAKTNCETFARYVVALLITVSIYLAFSVFFNITFFINDDENIMYTLSGYYTNGVPYDHPFINFALSYIIRLFYRVFPQIQWYTVFHFFIIVSAVTVFNSIMYKYLKNKIHFLLMILLSIVIDLGVFSYVMIQIQFTTTSTLSGCVAIILLYDLGVKLTEDQDKYMINIPFIVLYSSLSFMHRKNTFYVIACFMLLLFFYFLIILMKKKNKRNKWVLCITLIISILMVMMSSIVSGMKRNSASWKYYYSYDTARFHVTDYPHDSYSDNKELYNKIGWTQNLYTLSATYFWFFMDERVNADSFNAISETNKSEVNISEMLNTLKNFVKDNHIVLYEFVLLICFATMSFILFVKKKKILESLLVVCIVGAFGLFVAYLCYIQRIPLRAFHVVLYPTILLTIIVLFHNYMGSNNRMLKSIFYTFLITYCILLTYKTLSLVKENSDYRYTISRNTLMLEQYSMAHPDNTYIYDASLTYRYDPFVIYEDRYPSNLMFWGGMGWNSPAFFKQLAINDLKSSNSSVFFNDNVFYVSKNDYYLRDNRTLSDLFFDYMRETYGDIHIYTIQELTNGVTIYKIVRK